MKRVAQILGGVALGLVAAASTGIAIAGPAPGSANEIRIDRVVRTSNSRIAIYGHGFHSMQIYQGRHYDVAIRKSGEQAFHGMPVYHWSATRIDARIGSWRAPGNYYVYIMGPFSKPVSRGFPIRVLATLKPGTAKQLRQGKQVPRIGNKPIQIQPSRALPGAH